MKTRSLCLFLLLCVLTGHVHGQTKQDAENIRLRSLIGEKLNIDRITYWDSILADSRKYHLPFYESRSLRSIGHIYHLQDSDVQAIAAYTSSLNIAEENGYKVEMIELIKRLQVLYLQKFDRKRSLFMVYKGLAIAEELNDKRSVMDFYSSIALDYLTSGEVRKALKIHLRCLKICEEIGYDFGISSALVDIGTDYTILGDQEKAIHYYLESKKYVNKVREPGYVVQIYTSVSAAFQLMKQYDSAYYYADKAYKIAKRINNKRALASIMAELAGIDYDAGNNRNAKKMALKAIKFAQETRFTAQVCDLYANLKRIYIKEGNYKEALKTYELYVITRDSLSGEKLKKRAMEKEFSYNLEKKENEYRILAQQNQIQTLRLRQNHSMLFGLGALLVVILVVAWLFVRQNKFKSAHQQMRSEQKLLRLQMNPHFVFNSLNSIQRLVMNKQNDRAELYLSKFSKLIRDLLENSTKENLTVKEEIDMLNMYLEMESLRFGGAFSYSVKVDDRIDIGHTYIPPLMIQPFVENAIWHGLLAKEADRILEITIGYDSDKTIKCIIDDNGVGREASMPKENISQKKSLGLSFVKQRIGLIRETYKISGSVNIIDKKDELNNSEGTTVIIVLPILKS